MKRIKKHIKRLHKIKVHHNRWLIWAVAAAIIAGIALLSYIKVTTLNLDSQVTDLAYLSKNGVVYKDSFLQFSLYHPKSWGVEAENRNIIIFNDPMNYGRGISVGVFKLSDEAAIRKPLAVAKEESISINGRTGKKLTVTADSKNISEVVVLVANNDNLYVIRGSSEWFNHILSSFRFMPETNTINP